MLSSSYLASEYDFICTQGYQGLVELRGSHVRLRAWFPTPQNQTKIQTAGLNLFVSLFFWFCFLSWTTNRLQSGLGMCHFCWSHYLRATVEKVRLAQGVGDFRTTCFIDALLNLHRAHLPVCYTCECSWSHLSSAEGREKTRACSNIDCCVAYKLQMALDPLYKWLKETEYISWHEN